MTKEILSDKTAEFKNKNKKNLLYFHNCIVPLGFLPWEIRVAFPGESQLRQNLAI